MPWHISDLETVALGDTNVKVAAILHTFRKWIVELYGSPASGLANRLADNYLSLADAIAADGDVSAQLTLLEAEADFLFTNAVFGYAEKLKGIVTALKGELTPPQPPVLTTVIGGSDHVDH